MIKELAHFENSPELVEATEESLLKTLTFASSDTDDMASDVFPSSATGFAKTLILTAQPEGKVAGMALYFHNYSTWTSKPGIYLEDLFVRPEFRRRGYATLLLKALAGEVVKIK